MGVTRATVITVNCNKLRKTIGTNETFSSKLSTVFVYLRSQSLHRIHI